MIRPRLRPGLWPLPWLAPIAALGIVLLPTLLAGFPRGHDWQLELTRVAEYSHAVAEGQLPPYWASNIYGGHGAPVFLFYSPLFLIVATAATALVGSVATGALVAIWVFAVAGFAALADLARSIGSEASGARVAVLLFVLHPYFITDALLRNANAEFAALCLLPLPLAGVVRLASGARGGATRLAAGLALVVLAHNLTALAAAVAVVVLGIVLLWDAGWRVWLRFAAGCSLGLLLSAWLWIPALGYRHAIQMGELTRGGLDFHGNFGPIFGWGNYFAVGYLPALLLLGAFAWLLLRRPSGRSGRIAWTLASTAAVFLLLQLPASTPIWEAAPFLPLFQFPWRFQGPLALCTALLAGLAWADLSRSWRPGRRWMIEWLLLALLVLNAWPHLSNVRPLPADVRQDLATQLTPEGIRSHGLKVTVGNEYLPFGGMNSLDFARGPESVPDLRRKALILSLTTGLAALTWLLWMRVTALRRKLTASSSPPPPDSV